MLTVRNKRCWLPKVQVQVGDSAKIRLGDFDLPQMVYASLVITAAHDIGNVEERVRFPHEAPDFYVRIDMNISQIPRSCPLEGRAAYISIRT